MAYNSVFITAGDYIYYYDTSVGIIASLEWDLRGGTPTGATSANVTTQYQIQSALGYGTGLSVTDEAGVTDSVFVPGLIQVLPEIENLSLVTLDSSDNPIGSPSNVVDMSQDVKFQATGTIRLAPTGSYYYQFIIPGTGGAAGFTGTSQQSISVTKNTFSWIDLTGSEVGSTYTGYTGLAQLNITTPVGNIYSASTNVSYNKSGPVEFVNLADYPSFGATSAPRNVTKYQTTISYPFSSQGNTTSSIGMAGSGNVLYVYLNDSTIGNQKFHAHSEMLSLYTPSFEPTFTGSIPGQFTGQLVASDFALQGMESGFNEDIYTWDGAGLYNPTTLPYTSGNFTGLTRYTSGNYMFPGDMYSTVLGYKFYYADTNNQISSIWNQFAALGGGEFSSTITYNNPVKSWSISAVQAYLNDTSFGCITSRGYEQSTDTPASNLRLTGGETFLSTTASAPIPNVLRFRMGAVLPSGKWAQSDIRLTFDFYCSPTRNINTATVAKSITVTLGASGATGNSLDGNLIYANDRWYNSSYPAPTGTPMTGFASIINTALGSSGGTALGNYFGVTASPDYQWREMTYYTTGLGLPSCFFVQGAKFSIYDEFITQAKTDPRPLGLTGDTYLVKVVISDNSTSWFPATAGTRYTSIQWMGLKQNFVANPYQSSAGGTAARRGWYFHG